MCLASVSPLLFFLWIPCAGNLIHPVILTTSVLTSFMWTYPTYTSAWSLSCKDMMSAAFSGIFHKPTHSTCLEQSPLSSLQIYCYCCCILSLMTSLSTQLSEPWEATRYSEKSQVLKLIRLGFKF